MCNSLPLKRTASGAGAQAQVRRASLSRHRSLETHGAQFGSRSCTTAYQWPIADWLAPLHSSRYRRNIMMMSGCCVCMRFEKKSGT